MKYRLITILMLIASLNHAATVYQQTDDNNNTTYSDTPAKNAKVIEIPQENSISSIPKTILTKPTSGTSTKISEEPAAEERKPYTSFKITDPYDNQTFQNQRQIPVQVTIEPELQKGDTVQLYLDGNPNGQAVEGSALQLKQVDRGTHTISAVIFDKNKTIVRSTNTITVYIQYARLGGSGV
jgi:hypothetical protein